MNTKTGIICGCMVALILSATAGQGQPRHPGQARNLPPDRTDVRLTPEQKDEAETFLQEQDEMLYDNLMNQKTLRPQQYDRLIVRAYHEMLHLREMEQRDPEMYERLIRERKLDRETRLLAREIKQLESEAEIKARKEKLESKLNTLFDLRQENRLDEIRKLEEKIQELKENNATRLANKAAIVEHRMNELLGERGVMDW